MINGQEYAWASLFARLDTFMRQQQQISIDLLVANRHTREALDSLPARIASAISDTQGTAARKGRACAGFGWIKLMKATGDGMHRLMAALLPLAVVAVVDHAFGTRMLPFLSGLLR